MILKHKLHITSTVESLHLALQSPIKNEITFDCDILRMKTMEWNKRTYHGVLMIWWWLRTDTALEFLVESDGRDGPYEQRS